MWRHRIHRYKLIAARCSSCGRAFYPPISACPYCGSRSLDSIELPRVGRLVSYSIVYTVPFDDRSRSPIIIGLVDLGVTRLIAEIVDVNPEEVKIGDSVEAVFRRVSVDGATGLIVYGIKFRPRRVE